MISHRVMIGKNMACVAFEVWLVEEETVGWASERI